MKQLFKTLEFTDEEEITSFGKYVHIVSENQLGGSEIPKLMTLDTSLRLLKKIYPKQDFEGVKVTTLVVSEIETNNT